MSSTDPGAPSAAVRQLFRKALLPAAERARRDRGELFATGFDPQAATYYRRRARTTMTPADFELAGLESVDALAPALDALWRDAGLPELATLAPRLAELARSLRQVEQQAGEVSPFIYVMF